MAIAELSMSPADVLRRQLERAGIPPRYLDCRFRTFAVRQGTQRAVQAAQDVAVDARQGLVLCGPAGTGKTHLAVSMVAARIEQWLEDWPEEVVEQERDGMTYAARRPEVRVRLVSVPGFLDQLRSRIRFADSIDPLPDLIAADLLVLDDLGREKVTDWASERLYVLVNERYNALRPTVVTSNYPPDVLADRGYDAVISRLVEGSSAVVISAPDYRSARRG
jgi:DNA replication protein DnaC